MIESPIEKIRKIRRLANRTVSSVERASAEARIKVLMRRHGLSESDVDENYRLSVPEAAVDYWRGRVLFACARRHDCRVLAHRNGREAALAGTPRRVALAHQDYLHASAEIARTAVIEWSWRYNRDVKIAEIWFGSYLTAAADELVRRIVPPVPPPASTRSGSIGFFDPAWKAPPRVEVKPQPTPQELERQRLAVMEERALSELSPNEISRVQNSALMAGSFSVSRIEWPWHSVAKMLMAESTFPPPPRVDVDDAWSNVVVEKVPQRPACFIDLE